MNSRPSNTDSDNALEGSGAGTNYLNPAGAGLKLIVVLVVVIIIAGGFVVMTARHRLDTSNNLIRPAGLPPTISTQLASVMALSPILRTAAPGIRLTDQRDRPVSLASFVGRAVVLVFMDPHCVDICPIVSQELIDANRDLETSSSHVVFIAVNVNKYQTSVAAVDTFSREHQLNSIKSWHFLTGAPHSLQSIWAAYGVTVLSPSPKDDVIHSSYIFFIDAQGRERYLANPTDLHTSSGRAYLPSSSLTQWGLGIALVVKSLLR